MGYDLSKSLVVGISATALFDLTESDNYFRARRTENSLKAVEFYRAYMAERENDVLDDGTGMPLVKALLALNKFATNNEPVTEIVVLSRNSAETGIRVGFNIQEKKLDISRSVYTNGESVVPYLQAFNVDLFLTTSFEDAQKVIDSKFCAAAVLEPKPQDASISELDQVRIAFDGDAVLFDESSELIYKTSGLEAFVANESQNETVPIPEGPYAIFIKKLGVLQSRLEALGHQDRIRTALITARNAPSDRRVVNTLRSWGVTIDTVCFLGGLQKSNFIRAFGPHIFFDDQRLHLEEASRYVPSGHVPYASSSILNSFNPEG